MALFFNITASIFGALSVFILIVLGLVVFFPKIFQSFVERIPFITW